MLLHEEKRMLDTTPTRDRVAAMTGANIDALVYDHHHDMQQASIVLVDPPWSQVDPETLARLPVADLACADAALVLWCPNNRIPEAIAAVSAWGFGYRYMVQSDRRASSPSEAEFLIVATRGAMPAPALSIVSAGFRGLSCEKVFAADPRPTPWTARSDQEPLF